jgi:Tfp pilus assembly protein PilF
MWKGWETRANAKTGCRHAHNRIDLIARPSTQPFFILLPLAAVFLILGLLSATSAQGGGFTIYGDLKVDDSKSVRGTPNSYEVLLTGRNLSVISRQTIPKNGRFRFENLVGGNYDIIVRVDNTEVANVHVMLAGNIGTDYRKDVFLEWRANPSGKSEKGGVISALAHYSRSKSNQSLFENAEEAIRNKDFDAAVSSLRQIVRSDAKDFESWTELGTVYFIQKNNGEAEKSYSRALEAEPSFILALTNLGKLRLAQKNYEGAIEVLGKAVTVQPPSAEANYFLGEAYLNIKKGSKAVAYMNEAIRIDPIGKAEIHLRIADIYDSVGLKDLAAIEYEQFLKKKPDHPDKKKLQKYIANNRKP